MTKSESIGKIAEALAKAQGEFKALVKNKIVTVRGVTKTGKSYNYDFKYADLEQIIQITRPALSANGIAMIQTIGNNEISTMLIHSSGEWISDSIPIILDGDMQVRGAKITYLRRYSAAAILNLSAEDDDDGGKNEREEKQVDDFLNTKKGDEKETIRKEEGKKEKLVTKDFKFLEAMAKQKERIGEQKYYEILGLAGFEKSNEITDKDMQLSIFNQLKKEPTLKTEEEDIPI